MTITPEQRTRIDAEVQDFASRIGAGILDVSVHVSQGGEQAGNVMLTLFHPGSGPDWSMLATQLCPDGQEPDSFRDPSQTRRYAA